MPVKPVQIVLHSIVETAATLSSICYDRLIFCVMLFCSANNFAMQHKRKTISGQDVLDAMKEMEFERFVEPLKRSLEGMF